jgi:hypothetical protein
MAVGVDAGVEAGDGVGVRLGGIGIAVGRGVTLAFGVGATVAEAGSAVEAGVGGLVSPATDPVARGITLDSVLGFADGLGDPSGRVTDMIVGPGVASLKPGQTNAERLRTETRPIRATPAARVMRGRATACVGEAGDAIEGVAAVRSGAGGATVSGRAAAAIPGAAAPGDPIR